MGMLPMHATRVVLILGMCFALGAASLVATPAAATPTAVSVDLRVGFLELVDSLNPFQGINDPSYQFYGLIYDYLFSLDQDGNFVPNLAVNAYADATGYNWTYWIRQGVKWHDGTDFTADDVAFTINYNIQNFFQLWAFEPYVNRIIQCNAQTRPYCGAAVTSPWNVTVYFDRPFVPGKALFVPILQQAQWQPISASQAQYSFANPNPIGTGPFIADPNIYTQFLNMQPLALHKNPFYHPVGSHVGPAVLDTIYFQRFADENTLVVALEAGLIDLAKLTPAGYDAVQGYPNIGSQQGLLATQRWNEIGFSQLDSPSVNSYLNPARYDLHVRRALAMATNKDYIVNDLYQGRGVRGSSLISPITAYWWYDPAADPGANLSFDLQAANALLNASGYTVWTGGSFGNGYRAAASDISFIVETNAAPGGATKTVPAGTVLSFTMAVRQESVLEQDTAFYLAAQWARVGVRMNLKVELESALVTDVYGGTVETYIWYWSGDPDPNYLLSIESAYTLDGWNDNYWVNSTYNGLYRQQLAAFDPVQRQQLVRQAEKVHYESAVYLIYIYPYGEWAHRTDRLTNWGNWTVHPYRQMDAYWGANPLYLELAPLGAPPTNHPPSTPVIQGTPPLVATVNETVSFVGNATDPDPGQTLTWTWTWGDGQTTVITTTSAAQGVATDHAWFRPGFYDVTLTVSDGEFSATSAPFAVELFGVALQDAVGRPGQATSFAGIICEPTKGRWTLEFGDATSTTGSYPAGCSSVSVAHTYAVEGRYTTRLSIKSGSISLATMARALIDGTPPLLLLPSPITAEAAGTYTSIFFFVGATDNFGLAGPPTCNPASGSGFPLGTTTVRCQVMDLAGNVGYGNFTVTVRDTIPPTLTVPVLVSAEAASAAGAIVRYSVSATDAVGLASGPTCTPPSASLFPIGSTVVDCTAIDTSGNLARANLTVVVRDSVAPATAITGAVDGNHYAVSFYGRTPSPAISITFTATDAVGVVRYLCSLDGSAFVDCSSPVTYSGLSAGFHMLAVGAMDAAGNLDLAGFNWTVLTPVETVQDLVNQVDALKSAGNLTTKQANTLLAPLNKAMNDLQAGRVNSAIRNLRNFEAIVNDYAASGVLSPADARRLLDETCDLILTLGGTC